MVFFCLFVYYFRSGYYLILNTRSPSQGWWNRWYRPKRVRTFPYFQLISKIRGGGLLSLINRHYKRKHQKHHKVLLTILWFIKITKNLVRYLHCFFNTSIFCWVIVKVRLSIWFHELCFYSLFHPCLSYLSS